MQLCKIYLDTTHKRYKKKTKKQNIPLKQIKSCKEETTCEFKRKFKMASQKKSTMLPVSSAHFPSTINETKTKANRWQ